MKNRRVGTFTMGLSLIITGFLSIILLFTNAVSIFAVMKLSPLILVCLGAEMLVYSVRIKDETLKYDGLAIFVSFALIAGTLLSTAAVVVVDHFKLLN